MKDNLAKCRIILGPHNLVCPLCFGQDETLLHLIFSCLKSDQVWIMISNWIDIGRITVYDNTLDHLILYESNLKGKIKDPHSLF